MATAVSNALAIQGRVIQALMLRETKTRYGLLKLGYVWALIEPALQVGVFVAIFTLAGRESASGMPLVLFLITGITPFLAFRKSLQQVTAAVKANRQLLTFPQVTLFDLVFARLWLEAVTMVVVFILLVFFSQYLGEQVNIENLLGVCIAFLLMQLTAAGLGMLFCSLTPFLPSIHKLVNPFLGRPLFFTSGLFFTAEMLPPAVRDLLLYNPLLHLIEYLRSSFFYEFHSVYYDLGYAGAWALATFTLGIAAMTVNRDRLLNR